MTINSLPRDAIKIRVIEIIKQFVKTDDLPENEEDVHLLDIDSLIIMDIIIEIEKEFGVRISDTEILMMETFEKMMTIIYEKTKAA